ncbi:MAG: methyltransferase domain-containing protein [Sphingobium sp.]|nr:methyltransferase domain-containing protein [Sphingobium sp.]
MHIWNKSRAVALPHEGSIRERVAEYIHFMTAWLQKPRQTASVVPSSRFLARMMVRDMNPAGGRVLELGGGTGVFTRAILATGLPSEKLEVVEINADFAHGLEQRFPGVAILRHRAEAISAHVAGEEGSYQQIISGLPLLAMNQATQKAILEEAFRLLAPGGTFVQFTYSVLPPVNRQILDDLGLSVIRAGNVIRNFPPATVFHFQRIADAITAPMETELAA